jgi:gliding motility-associated-like protein
MYSYHWSNNESTDVIQNLTSGNYSLQVTDANGCVATANGLFVDNIIVPVNFSLGNDTVICNGQTLLLQPGNFTNYLWQDNSTAPNFLVTQTGTYSVEVTNDAGCQSRDEINVIVDCKDVYFPSSFTPDGDHLNDAFGPIGDVGALSNYTMDVFNRWGQLVFHSSNPFQKWDGKFRDKVANMDSFVWVASYRLYGKNILNRKGTVTIIK